MRFTSIDEFTRQATNLAQVLEHSPSPDHKLSRSLYKNKPNKLDQLMSLIDPLKAAPFYLFVHAGKLEVLSFPRLVTTSGPITFGIGNEYAYLQYGTASPDDLISTIWVPMSTKVATAHGFPTLDIALADFRTDQTITDDEFITLLGFTLGDESAPVLAHVPIIHPIPGKSILPTGISLHDTAVVNAYKSNFISLGDPIPPINAWIDAMQYVGLNLKGKGMLDAKQKHSLINPTEIALDHTHGLKNNVTKYDLPFVTLSTLTKREHMIATQSRIAQMLHHHATATFNHHNMMAATAAGGTHATIIPQPTGTAQTTTTPTTNATITMAPPAPTTTANTVTPTVPPNLNTTIMATARDLFALFTAAQTANATAVAAAAPAPHISDTERE